jgi:hypothetical protein
MRPYLVSLLLVLTAALAGAEPGPGALAPPAAESPVREWSPQAMDPGPPSGPRPLPFFYDLYTFRGSGDSTVVVAAFSVPAGSLRRETRLREIRYRFDVTLVLADTTLRTVFRSDDSVFVRLPRPLAGAHLLSTHVAVQAPPSNATIQRVIMTDAVEPGIGQLYTSAFPVPDYSGSHLMLSDVALTQPDAGAGWQRGGVRLALLPTAEFPGSAFEVYYEVYNLPRDHRYTTEIAVERVADGRGRAVENEVPVRVRYAGESLADASGTLPELRYVDASVGDGRYRIDVIVTDQETGQTATRSRYFQVSGWAPGTTLVPAIPRGDARVRVRGQ